MEMPFRSRALAISSIGGKNTGTRHEQPVMRSADAGLFAGWVNDAGLFPPAALTITQAVANFARHRVSWYDEVLANFVSIDDRLVKVDSWADRLGMRPLDVTVVVPAGLDALPHALETLHRCSRLRLRAIELPIGASPILIGARAAAELAEHGVTLYVEVPSGHLSERRIHQLRIHGMRLKIRGGGSSIDSFNSEDQLALTIINCAAEQLPFTCVTGVSRAVRHRDLSTLLQRHGYLNIALATLAAVNTGSHAAVRDLLAERDHEIVAHATRTLARRDVATVRSLFACLGSNDVFETVTDLTTLAVIAKT
jgi:hypothetical protein